MNWSTRYKAGKAVSDTVAAHAAGDREGTISNYMNANSLLESIADHHYGKFLQNQNGPMASHHLSQVSNAMSTLQDLHKKIDFPSLMPDVNLSGLAPSGLTGKVSVSEEHSQSPGAQRVIKASEDELDKRYGPEEEGSSYDYSDLAKENGGSFLTARINGQLVGGVGVGNMGNKIGEVRRLWVHPQYRGHGIASSLMSAAIDKGKQLGHKQLYLETGWAQPEAQQLYSSTGWTPTNTYPQGKQSYSMTYRFKRDI